MCFYWSVELKTRTQKTHMSNLSQAVRFSLTLPLWTIYILQWTRQTCGLKKLTGKMEMMLQRNEWISLIGCRTFQRYVFMLSTRFVRTSGIVCHKIWSHFLFALHLEAYLALGLWWTCLWYDYFFVMLETEESISEGAVFKSSFRESVSENFLHIFCWIHSGTVSKFLKRLWTMNLYRHHNLGKFCRHINSLQFANHFCNLLGYPLLN